jgi:hypothetical protein
MKPSRPLTRDMEMHLAKAEENASHLGGSGGHDNGAPLAGCSDKFDVDLAACKA